MRGEVSIGSKLLTFSPRRSNSRDFQVLETVNPAALLFSSPESNLRCCVVF
jgi:hypothetical protein